MMAKRGEFPMSVRLMFAQPARSPEEPEVNFCGGSFLTEIHILSRGTCVKARSDAYRWRSQLTGIMADFYYGSVDHIIIRREKDLSKTTFQMSHLRFEPHITFPSFLITTLLFKSRIMFARGTAEASCLFIGDPRYIDDMWVKIVGYGPSEDARKAILSHGWVRTIPKLKMKEYLYAFKFPEYTHHDVLEGSYHLTQPVVGLCNGDQGTPVMINMLLQGKRRWIQVGIGGYILSVTKLCVGTALCSFFL